MRQLNLPEYKFKIIEKNDKIQIFDTFRKKFVALTPEEWVRQNFIKFLTTEGKFKIGSIALEKQLKINGLVKRCDAVIYDNNLMPKIILEFKAPDIELSQAVFDQVATYNLQLKVDYFIISNGLNHFICKVNYDMNKYDFQENLPVI